MSTDTITSQLVINKLTQAQYDTLDNNNQLNDNELYFVTDGSLSYNDLTDKPTIPTKTSDLTNDNEFISGITSSDVTTALGFTPYNSSNPSGYTSNIGTVTSVNNISPVNGNVTLSVPTVDQSYSGISTNAQSGIAVKSAIDAAIASVYKPAGSIAFASLPTPASTNEGNVYNITDAFTTDSRFVEGSGKTYPAGSNVVIIEATGNVTYYCFTCRGRNPIYSLNQNVQQGDMMYKITNGVATEYAYAGTVSNNNIDYLYTYIDGDYHETPLPEDYIYDSSGNIVLQSSGYFFDVLAGMVDLSGYVPTSRTINSKALSSNISLTASDVNAVASNTAITGATKCKITYDSKGLVTAGDNLSASDIPDISATYQTKITSSNKISADNISDGTTNKTVTATEKSTWSGKQDALVSGTSIKTINNTSLLGSGNISTSPTFIYDSSTETLTIS